MIYLRLLHINSWGNMENLITTFDEVLKLLRQGKSVELKFFFNYGLFSRHELSFCKNKIEDFSFVDESTTNYTIAKYKNSFYGKAFLKKAVMIEEVYDELHQPLTQKGNHLCRG